MWREIWGQGSVSPSLGQAAWVCSLVVGFTSWIPLPWLTEKWQSPTLYPPWPPGSRDKERSCPLVSGGAEEPRRPFWRANMLQLRSDTVKYMNIKNKKSTPGCGSGDTLNSATLRSSRRSQPKLMPWNRPQGGQCYRTLRCQRGFSTWESAGDLLELLQAQFLTGICRQILVRIKKRLGLDHAGSTHCIPGRGSKISRAARQAHALQLKSQHAATKIRHSQIHEY